MVDAGAAYLADVAIEQRKEIQSSQLFARRSKERRCHVACDRAHGLCGGILRYQFWLPQILKEYALSNQAIGLLSAIPYIVATFGMVIWGGYSDQSGSRARHVAAGCLLGAVGLLAA